MTPVLIAPTTYAQERARLLDAIATIQVELDQVQVELARVRARIHASNQNTFTITFIGGQIALLDVRGASDIEEARDLAHAAFKNCQYTTVDGDQSGGHAAYFYLWCSSAAQEMQPYHR